jgi:hypothetical protein
VSDSKNNPCLTRRAWLISAASASAGALLLDGGAFAEAAPLPHVDEKSPTAHGLGYVADGSRIDPKAEPTFKAGSRCSNCLQLQGKAGDAWRPCTLFPGQLVSAAGWCRVWVPKPQA